MIYIRPEFNERYYNKKFRTFPRNSFMQYFVALNLQLIAFFRYNSFDKLDSFKAINIQIYAKFFVLFYSSQI
jgi:hypothetical protein